MKRYIYLLLVLSAFLFCDKCLGLNYSEPEIIINDTLESPLHLSDSALSADTFFISKAINMTINSYPTVRKAMENIDIARVNSKIENDIYLPSLSGTASYLWLDPISQLTMGDKTVHIQSHNNASFGVSLNQLIWDFGKSRPKIDAARLEYEVAELDKKQLIQNLSLKTIENYMMTAYTRYSINVKLKQLEDYTKLLSQTEIKRNTGSATNFDFLNTGSALNAIKTELIALNTSKQRQYISLSLLTDTIINDNTVLSLNTEQLQVTKSIEELINEALESRIEMNIISKQYEIALEQKRIDDRMFYPTLSLGASLGAKNGYEPSLGDLRFNYSAGATLKIPIYESNKRFHQRTLGKIGVNKAATAIDIVKKEITAQVADCYLSLVSSFAKSQQLEVQLNVALKAYEQAKINYEAGSITNLELLTSSNNAVNSELYLLQEKINYKINYYKLMIAIGVLIENLNLNPL